MFDENGPYLLPNTIIQNSYFWNMKTYTILYILDFFILCYLFLVTDYTYIPTST